MSLNGHASSMLMHTGTECRRLLQADHSCALPLGGRVAKLEGLGGPGSPSLRGRSCLRRGSPRATKGH